MKSDVFKNTSRPFFVRAIVLSLIDDLTVKVVTKKSSIHRTGRIVKSKKVFLCHNFVGKDIKCGDFVDIYQSRPFSKLKRHFILKSSS